MAVDTSVLIAIASDEPEPFQEAIGQDPTRLMVAPRTEGRRLDRLLGRPLR
jgi:uncharacterized protein with PIN domain